MKMPSAETMLADIRAKCRECCGGSVSLVEECTIRTCRLHKYRRMTMGVQTAMFATDQLDGQLDMFDIGGQSA